jgi:hypothetical protein
MASFEHLRLRLDELEHRAEETRDTGDRRRFLLDVVALERALAVAEERLALETQQAETLRKRLRRLRAVG